MVGVVTVNNTPLLGTPPTITITLPVVAAVGTTAVIDVSLQLLIPPFTPWNVTSPDDAT